MGISIELAKRGEALTGAYSRFGFRHPGPVMSYYYALSESAWSTLAPGTSTPMGMHLVAQVLFNIACLLVVAYWFTTNFPILRRAGLSCAVVPISFLAWWGAGRTFLHDYWNPTVTIAPMMVFLLSGASLLAGKLRWLPFFCLSGVVLVHSHLSAAPLALMAWAIVIVGSTLRIRAEHRSILSALRKYKFSCLSALAILSLGLTPPLIEALTVPQFGNVGAIVASLSNGVPSGSLSAAFHWIGGYFTFQLPIPKVLALLLSSLLLVLIAVRTRNESRYAAILCLSVIIAALLSASQVRGQWDPYILRSMLGVSAVSLLLVFFSTCTAVFRQIEACPSGRIGILTLLFSVACGYALLPKPFTPRAQKCGRIAKPFIDALQPKATDYFRLEISDHAAWPFAAPFGLSLLRHGASFCVSEEWRYLFDSALVCRSSSDQPRLLVVYRAFPDPLPERLQQMQSFTGPINTLFWE